MEYGDEKVICEHAKVFCALKECPHHARHTYYYRCKEACLYYLNARCVKDASGEGYEEPTV